MAVFKGNLRNQFFWKMRKITLKLCITFAKNKGVCPSRISSMVFVIIVVILDGHTIKHMFKRKNVRYCQNSENITHKHCTVMTLLLSPSKTNFYIFKKGHDLRKCDKNITKWLNYTIY